MEKKNVFIILTRLGRDNTYIYGSYWDYDQAIKVIDERNKQGFNSWITISTPQ